MSESSVVVINVLPAEATSILTRRCARTHINHGYNCRTPTTLGQTADYDSRCCDKYFIYYDEYFIISAISFVIYIPFVVP